MKTVEYGVGHDQVILLLHGGGLNWWSCRDAAELLQHRYHVVIPVLDGHPGSDRPFTSIEACAAGIISCIDTRFGGSVALIAGLSLGGQILAEMLSLRKDLCRAAIIESASVIPMKLTRCLVGPMLDMSYGLIKKPWFSRLQFRYLGIKEQLYPEYFEDTCRITKEDMKSFLKANASYPLKEAISQTKARVLIFAGRKEPSVVLRSAKLLSQKIPGSTLEIGRSMRHGDLSINRPAEFAAKVTALLEAER